MSVDRYDPEFMRTHVGASEWPAILGESRFLAPIDLWQQKVDGKTEEVDADRQEIMDLGNELEDGVRRNVARRLGVEIAKPDTIEHPSEPYLCASPDGLVLSSSAHASEGDTVEIKVTGRDEEWGEPGTDEVPRPVIVQVTGAMMVVRDRRAALATAVGKHSWSAASLMVAPPPDRCHVAALLPERGRLGVRLYVVQYDAELAEMFASKVREFWRHVVERTPPPPDDSEAYDKYMGRRFPTTRKKDWLQPTALVDALALDCRNAKRAKEKAEADYRYARNSLEALIGSKYGVQQPWGSVTWHGVQGKAELRTERALVALTERVGQVRAIEMVRECQTLVLEKEKLAEKVRALTKTKKEADALIEACSERAPGYRCFKVNDKEKGDE